MRIDLKAVAVSQTALESAKPQDEGSGRSRSMPAPAASVVRLSSAAGGASAERPAAIVTARIARIRAMLDAGTYPVDLDQLAACIVDNDLLRPGTGS